MGHAACGKIYFFFTNSMYKKTIKYKEAYHFEINIPLVVINRLLGWNRIFIYIFQDNKLKNEWSEIISQIVLIFSIIFNLLMPHKQIH